MKQRSENMRKRAGIILLCTGCVLIIKPNFNVDQIMMAFNYFVANYWPVAFIAVGAMLLWPQPKRKSNRRTRT